MYRISNAVHKISRVVIRRTLTKAIHNHVDNATVMDSFHELAQQVNSLTNNNFQHPGIGRVTFEKQGCESKICDKPCSTMKEKVYVGHITHSDKYGKFISYNDFNNNQFAQYFIPYNPPIKNHDSKGQDTNESRTAKLNQQHTEARTLIHIYSSHNPLDDTI